ncbi:coiled-coil-helix-coiled-coil-helix domain-containing protein 7 isoform X2 [Erpetoichthys calabaricus]|uniref:Coiled-coil-helix-coiled-coil-helix domain-containing protein 7 n=2 Tax=Polypteridae TaxID=8289 RepID=A0A8C4RVP2_ERPCA
MARKLRDSDINPCLEESDASRKCLDMNNYSKDKCTLYFLHYKNCRAFWNNIAAQRRRDGVKPVIPPADERVRILQDIGGKPY